MDLLLACIASRPLYITSGINDMWNDNAEVIAVADPFIEEAKKVTARFGIKTVTTAGKDYF